MKIFEPRGIRANGNLLPFSDFRLYSDLEDLTPDPEKLAEVIKRAEEALCEDVPPLTLSMYRDYVKNGNRSRFESPFFRRRDKAMWLAIAEGYEKQGRFTEKLADYVWAILEESTWIAPAHLFVSPYKRNDGTPPVIGKEMLHGVDLFASTTASALTMIYTVAKDELDKISKTICEKLVYTVKERIIKPFLQCPFWWTGESGRVVNNWAPWISENILFVTALLEKDDSVRVAVVNRCLGTLDNFLKNYAPDGGCDEGPAYWGSAGGSLFDCLELLYDMSGGKINVYDSELIRNIGDYIYKVNINGRHFVNFADCAPRARFDASMLVRFGKKCASQNLSSFGYKFMGEGNFFVENWHGYRGLKNLYESSKAPEYCPMPRYTLLPDLMLMTARSTDDTERGTFLAMKGGHNDEQHNHNDVGNVIVYRNAVPVIIDVGVGIYTKQTFSPDRYKLWFMQSGYHNLPSFSGVDQQNGRRFSSFALESDAQRQLYSIDLTAAYPEEAGLEKYTRTSRMDGECVTVTDSYRLKREGGCAEFHFMTARAPKPVREGEILLDGAMTMLYDTSLGMRIDEIVPDGLNAKVNWDTEVLYRISFTSQSPSATYTFTVRPTENT